MQASASSEASSTRKFLEICYVIFNYVVNLMGYGVRGQSVRGVYTLNTSV